MLDLFPKEIDHLLSQTMDLMEQGKFQDFILQLLPFIDVKYANPILIGGTEEGKTRKGTPDIICTHSNGDQIAIQCSVEKNYWKTPESSELIKKWKPCEDIAKCDSYLDHLIEIVLCSSDSIPTDSANSYSQIIGYANSSCKQRFTIAFYCKQSIVSILAGLYLNPECEHIFEFFFPQVHKLIRSLIQGVVSNITIDIFKSQAGATLENIESAIQDVLTSSGLDASSIKNITLSKLSSARSPFERPGLPDAGMLTRTFNKDFDISPPINKIVFVLGLPKIGKTTLVAGCAKRWQSDNLKVRWFDCPNQENLQLDFLSGFLHAFLSTIIPNSIAFSIAYNKQPIEILNYNDFKLNSSPLNLFILDNLDAISDSTFQSLSSILLFLRNKNLLINTGILFISSKRLSIASTITDLELFAPKWDSTELVQFIKLFENSIPGLEDKKYVDILCSLSAGHPHIALSLARRFPSSSSELLLSGIQAPKRIEEGFGNQLSNFLFNSLLRDNDSKTFIIRLSNVIHKSGYDFLLLLKDFSPGISSTLPVLISQLRGILLEGDDKAGYEVALIYKECCRDLLSASEKKAFFHYLAINLLRAKNRTLDFDEIEQGLYYAVFAADYRLAFDWGNLLLISLFRNNNVIIEHKLLILNRLKFLIYLPSNTDLETLSIKNLFIIGLSTSFDKLGKHDIASEIESKFTTPQVFDSTPASLSIQSLSAMVELSKAMRIMQNSPDKGVLQLSKSNLNNLIRLQPRAFSELLMFLGTCSNFIKDRNCLENFLLGLLRNALYIENTHIADLISLVETYSLLAFKENNFGVLSKLDQQHPLSQFLFMVAKATFSIEDKSYTNAQVILVTARKIAKDNNWLIPQVDIQLLQLEGDTYFCHKMINDAINCYENSLMLLSKRDRSYSYAWAHFRIGLIHSNTLIAISHLKNASLAFSKNGYFKLYAISEGELSVLYALTKNYPAFGKTVQKLITHYYSKDGNIAISTSCSICLSHIGRLQRMLANKTSEEIDETVPIERMVHFHASKEIIPSGKAESFLILGMLWDTLGKPDNANEMFLKVTGLGNNEAKDANSIVLSFHYLIPSLIRSANVEYLDSILVRGICIQSFDKIDKQFLCGCLFSSFDNLPSNSITKQNAVSVIVKLIKVEIGIKKLNIPYLNWWRAELRFRIARFYEIYLKGTSKNSVKCSI